MRVVLKPVGLFCIVGAFIGLVILATMKHNEPAAPGALATVSTPAPDAAAAAATNTASNASTPAPVAQVSLPPGVLLEPDIATRGWKTLDAAGKLTNTVVPATVPGHPYARQLQLNTPCKNYWDVQVAHPLNVALVGGKRIQLSFFARSKDSCPITAVVEENADPYTRVLSKDEALTPSWKQYTESWVQQANTPENWAKMDFQVGHQVGTVEITGVTIRQIADGG